MAQINWFEIPATDFARAVTFYNTMLNVTLDEGVFGDIPHGFFEEVLSRVEQAGGAVLQPQTSIGPQGSIALIRDTEGNRIGLHAYTA